MRACDVAGSIVVLTLGGDEVVSTCSSDLDTKKPACMKAITTARRKSTPRFPPNGALDLSSSDMIREREEKERLAGVVERARVVFGRSRLDCLFGAKLVQECNAVTGLPGFAVNNIRIQDLKVDH